MDRLEDYIKLVNEACEIKDEIDIINAEMRCIKVGSDNTPVKGGGGGNKLDGLIDKKDKLSADYELLMARATAIKNRCERILNSKEYEICSEIFFRGMGTEEAIRSLLDREVIYDRNYGYKMRRKILARYGNLDYH